MCVYVFIKSLMVIYTGITQITSVHLLGGCFCVACAAVYSVQKAFNKYTAIFVRDLVAFLIYYSYKH